MITKFSKEWRLVSFITSDVEYIENIIRDNLISDEKATNISINFDSSKIIVTFTAECT